MQQQPTVSELRVASDEAVAAAQAGLGPLFASHLQTQLLERPQDFVNDQVPLVSAAARARLALLDAEAAETDAATTPAALKRLLEREVSKVLGAPVPAPAPNPFAGALDLVLAKLNAPTAELANGTSPILTASILAGEACELFEGWLQGESTEHIAAVQTIADRAQARANFLLAGHKATLDAFEAGDGNEPFAWVVEHAPAAASKWREGRYSNERKWALKACELLNAVVLPPTGPLNGDLPPFFYSLGTTDGKVDSVCTMHATWMVALDLATANGPSMRFGAVASKIHAWLRQRGTDVEIEMQGVEGGTVWLPQPLFAEDDFVEGLDLYDSTNTTAASTYHLLRGYVLEYRKRSPTDAYVPHSHHRSHATAPL